MRWSSTDPTVKAAVIGGLFTVAAGVIAVIVASIVSKPSPEGGVRAPTATTATQQSPATDIVKLSIERIAFDDGGTQISDLGCPNGHFFAAPRTELAEQLSREPEEVWSLGRLLPGTLFIAIDTQIPQGDYIRLSAVDLIVERYSSEPSSPPLIMESTTCADEGPDSGDIAFDVVLDPNAHRIPLLESAAGVGHVVKQNDPVILEFGMSARAPGWYRINAAVRFRHGTNESSASLPHSIELFCPSRRDSKWFYYPLGGPVRGLSRQHVNEIEAALKEWGPGFPPPLAAPTSRSGPRPPGKAPLS